MKNLALAGLLGLAGMVSGCGDGNECGMPGTHLEGNTCVADPVDFAGIGEGKTCGPGTMASGNTCVPVGMCAGTMTLNSTTGKCELNASACAAGTTLNATKDGCAIVTDFGSLVFAGTSDQNWSTLKYLTGSSLTVIGDAYHVTSGAPDSAEIYLKGFGGNTDPTKSPKFGGVNPLFNVWWDANPDNPSTAPSAVDHVITVGEWKKCTQKFAYYKNPPSAPGKKYYKLTVDVTDCPANLMFEMWQTYSNDATLGGRILGTTAGGLPNVFQTMSDGKGHYERDMDPNVWFKYGTALNGNTHGAAGMGSIPTSDKTTATVAPATFVHNDGQSNGNYGWCYPATGPSADGTLQIACASPPQIGKNFAGGGTAAWLYLPGKVGYESIPAFQSGTPGSTQANVAPLAMMQPY